MKRVAVAVLFAASASSFAVNLQSGAGWAFVSAALLSLLWRPVGLSPGSTALAKRFLHIALVLMGILGWILVTYPVLGSPTLRLCSLALGYAFGVLGSLFLVTEGLAPREGSIPAGIGLMVVSAFDLEAGIHPYLFVAGAAGFLYLASGVWGRRAHRRWARAMGIALFALPCVAAALGIVIVLPWTQGRIEEAVIAAYIPKTEGGEGSRKLGDLRSLKLSRKVVMRVYSERPQKLRSAVLVRFDGASWHGDPTTMRTLSPVSVPGLGESEREFLSPIPGNDFVLASGELPGERLVRTAVVRVDGSGLATPGGSLLVHAPLENVQVDSAGIALPPPRTAVRWYAVLHQRDHRRSHGEPAREADLQLPPVLDPRVPELAAEIAAGESSPERVVEKVVSRLRGNYSYSLDVGEVDPRDPIADFLFRKKEGWCEYFATSAAILLRTRGIPTRYVSGFNVIGSQRKGDYYLVRDWDRHAWIEAYIEGRGWIEYDPTPAAEYESLHAGAEDGFWTDAIEWLKAEWATLSVRLRYLDASLVAGALGSVLVVFGLVRIVRRRARRVAKLAPREASRAPSTGLEDLVRKLDRRTEELGFRRSKATPPLEHWESVPRARLSGRERTVGVFVLESFYRARFGGVAVSREEAERMGRILSEVTVARDERERKDEA